MHINAAVCLLVIIWYKVRAAGTTNGNSSSQALSTDTASTLSTESNTSTVQSVPSRATSQSPSSKKPAPRREPDEETAIPTWAIVVIVILVVIGLSIFIIVFCSTDDEGHLRKPSICGKKPKYGDEDNAILSHGYKWPFGHVPMKEVRMGRLHKRGSERSIKSHSHTDTHTGAASASDDPTVSYRKEKDVAILDRTTVTPTTRSVEFATTFQTHEITENDPNRAADTGSGGDGE